MINTTKLTIISAFLYYSVMTSFAVPISSKFNNRLHKTAKLQRTKTSLMKHFKSAQNAEKFRQMSKQSFDMLTSDDFEEESFPSHQQKIDQQKAEEIRNAGRRKIHQLRSSNLITDFIPLFANVSQTPSTEYNVSHPMRHHNKLSQTRRKHKSRHHKGGRRQAMRVATSSPLMLPESDDCRTQTLKQRVRMKGCITRVVYGNFCYGVCRSFFIPRLMPTASGEIRPAFRSCSMCAPIDYEHRTIILQCPNMPKKQVKRNIVLVKKCACKNVEI